MILLQSNFHGPFTHKSTKHNDPNKVKTKDHRALVTNINRDTRVPTGRYSPFGKGIGNPERDRHGNVKGKKMTLDTSKVTQCRHISGGYAGVSLQDLGVEELRRKKCREA